MLPGSDAQSYLLAASQRERSKISSSAKAVPQDSSIDEVAMLDSPQARLSLLDKFDAVSPYLPPSDPSLDKATLSHWDLHTANLFVEEDQITSVIDWQDCWA
jgi:Ser/Thr protein kinase RdoA (MazF antagonist)